MLGLGETQRTQNAKAADLEATQKLASDQKLCCSIMKNGFEIQLESHQFDPPSSLRHWGSR